MKKIIPLVWIGLLCLGLLVYSLLDKPAAPATHPAPTQPTEPSSTPPAESSQPELTDPEPTEPSGPETPITAYLRISLPETTSAWETVAWEAIAELYSQDAGVGLVFTDSAPDLILTSRADAPQDSNAYVDLTVTEAHSLLIDWELALTIDGKVCGVAVDTESYGIIYNSQLLAKYGVTADQITDFASLSAVADSIVEQGSDAFATADLQYLAEILAGVPGNVQPLLDLYIQTTGEQVSTTHLDSLNQLLNNEAVFYIGSTADHQALSSMGDHQIGVLPLYLGGENEATQSLAMVSRSYFCIPAHTDADAQALAKDFLSYLITPVDGLAPIDILSVTSPYRTTSYTANSFEQKLRDDVAAGGWVMVCQDLAETPEGLAGALQSYVTNPTEENWAKVENYLQKQEDDQ